MKDKCPSCEGLKDIRATECGPCRFKNRHPRLGTGKAGIGKHINAAGYVVISNEDKYEHRIIMEKLIGRRLGNKEHVHHKNGNRSDNRPENLELMSASEHAKEHIAPRAKEMSLRGHAARWGG